MLRNGRSVKVFFYVSSKSGQSFDQDQFFCYIFKMFRYYWNSHAPPTLESHLTFKFIMLIQIIISIIITLVVASDWKMSSSKMQQKWKRSNFKMHQKWKKSTLNHMFLTTSRFWKGDDVSHTFCVVLLPSSISPCGRCFLGCFCYPILLWVVLRSHLECCCLLLSSCGCCRFVFPICLFKTCLPSHFEGYPLVNAACQCLMIQTFARENKK